MRAVGDGWREVRSSHEEQSRGVGVPSLSAILKVRSLLGLGFTVYTAVCLGFRATAQC